MRMLLLCVLLFSFVVTVHADDDPSTFWTVETRCIPEPTEPPDDWTFDGTLLLLGSEGVYTYSSDTPTLEIAASILTDDDTVFLHGGQLSPDGNWYAVPVGYVDTQTAFNYFFYTSGIRLYSLVDDTIIDLELSEESQNRAEWAYSIVTWLNDDALVAADTLFYPFEGRSEPAPFYSGDFSYSDFFVSPDQTRIYSYEAEDFPLPAAIQAVAELPTSALSFGVAWRHDSTGFLAPVGDNQDGDTLMFYDQDGEQVEAVFDLDHGSVNFETSTPGLLGSLWSPDDQYTAITRYSPDLRQSSLYLLDWEAQTVVDTCLSARYNAVWSPDGSMLAYFEPAEGSDLNIVVIDLAAQQAYRIGTHSGEYTPANEPPELLGWRGE